MESGPPGAFDSERERDGRQLLDRVEPKLKNIAQNQDPGIDAMILKIVSPKKGEIIGEYC
jgi:hypothetical protein